MELRTLEGLSSALVHAAYRAGMADYEQPLLEEPAAFEAFLRRRGADPLRSVAAFDGERPVGLQLTAVGDYGYEGTATAYDVLTCVVPEHRGRGLAGRMFEHVLALLAPGEAEQFLLECLETNAAALSAYTKQGFTRSRRLVCLELERDHVRTDPPAANVAVRDVQRPDWVRLTDLHSWQPSWQNAAGAMQRADPAPRVVGAYRDELLVGYAALFPETGDLARFAVRPEHQAEGIGSVLLAACVRRLPADVERFGIVNVPDDATGDLRFFEGRGARVFARQVEMWRRL